MASNHGQHFSRQDLLVVNAREVIRGALRHLDSGVYINVDYVRYRLEWLIAVITRFGQSFEKEAVIIHYLQSALSSLASLESLNNSPPYSPTVVRSGNKGRPKFSISDEQLQLYLDYGFKATDIANILCVSVKTVHRRLREYGLSLRGSYCDMTDDELDTHVESISQEFPNCGYKTMRGHLLSRGIKVQENRVRESLRRTDPEGTSIRALQLRVTHRRVLFSCSLRSQLTT